jgi:hypothetical protein
MENKKECQIPCLPNIAEGYAKVGPQPFINRLKRTFARPWNYYIKKKVRKYSDLLFTSFADHHYNLQKFNQKIAVSPDLGLQAGDLVRVRSKEEIEATLDRWKELKGCGFLDYMWQYCGTSHRVLKVMEKFLDERDYKVKKCKGLVLLEGVICHGTPIFGQCDRCCHFFWREEWLEKIGERPV